MNAKGLTVPINSSRAAYRSLRKCEKRVMSKSVAAGALGMNNEW